MALKLSLKESILGIPLDEAYIKIEHIRGDKSRIEATLTIHATEEARKADKVIIQMIDIRMPTEKFTGLPSLYEYIKTLPEFAGAQDC